MDTRPAKIARLGNAVDVHSTGNVGLVRMDPEVDGRLEAINYFAPSYMDVWPEILDYLTEESDINAVLCASPMFGTAWGSRRAAALFPIVIQILLEKKYLSLNNDILTCRRVNKASKLNVDDLLLKKQSCRLSCHFQFEDSGEIESFMEHFKGATVSPFMLKDCHVQADDTECFDRTVDMLTEFGNSLNRFTFEMSFNDNRPQPLMDGIVEVLELLPNILSLELKFPGYDAEFEDVWETFRRRPGTSFPPLNDLKELSLVIDEVEYDQNYPPSSFMKPILKAYGKQLTKLVCNGFFLEDVDAHFLTSQFCGLRSFEIHENYPEVDGFIISHEKLSQVEWPKLEDLKLGGQTRYTKETFAALNNFRNSLKNLQLDSLENRSFHLNDIDPMDVLPFPLLSQLIVDMSEANSALWHFFRNQFVHLVTLSFQSSDSESIVEDDSSVPDQNVNLIKRRFFTIFPNLKFLVWMPEYGETSCYKRELSL